VCSVGLFDTLNTITLITRLDMDSRMVLNVSTGAFRNDFVCFFHPSLGSVHIPLFSGSLQLVGATGEHAGTVGHVLKQQATATEVDFPRKI
jgi:hypothetical protein